VAANRPSLVNLALLQSPAIARVRVESDLLSWDSSWRTLSHEPPVCPSIDVPTERPLPHDVAIVLRTRIADSSRVPSAWFLTTSTGSSARRLQVYCALLPILGFAVFLARAAICTTEAVDGTTRTFLDGVCRTPRRIPLIRSRTVSPRPLPPCRSPPSRPALPFVFVAKSELVRMIRRVCRLRGVAPPMSP